MTAALMGASGQMSTLDASAINGEFETVPTGENHPKGNCQANPPANQRASNVRRNYRKRTVDLDRAHAPEVVGDGTNGQVGPFEEALGQFHTGNVFPIVAGAFSEVNEDASKLVTNLARLTHCHKTDFGKSIPSAREAYQTAEDNHSKHRSRPKASMSGYARWWQNFIPEGCGLYQQWRNGKNFGSIKGKDRGFDNRKPSVPLGAMTSTFNLKRRPSSICD
ncbi:hypothetical protein THAOC_09799 [Thalassiosira oceanica]|uniref:Uncharacterized protein n=1 Tax=Thalassiosira oceanica TaxID=159749 RepID=K0SRP9_THAOC|nr:hypothetical protein THAOC_09799 [Thalassiosira oceanica]|eukprot:EJK68988.1 hypothetical protein THAOC_09799 [Thalassiosira oceanica]